MAAFHATKPHFFSCTCSVIVFSGVILRRPIKLSFKPRIRTGQIATQYETTVPFDASSQWRAASDVFRHPSIHLHTSVAPCVSLDGGIRQQLRRSGKQSVPQIESINICPVRERSGHGGRGRDRVAVRGERERGRQGWRVMQIE